MEVTAWTSPGATTGVNFSQKYNTFTLEYTHEGGRAPSDYKAITLLSLPYDHVSVYGKHSP